MSYEALQQAYRAAEQSAALFDLGQRTTIELSGAERAKFLHNLCTQEVKKLAPGRGAEALWLDSKGQVLFHGVVFNPGETLQIDSEPGANERLAAHLDRYLIREQVTIVDRTAEFATLLVAGPRAAELLQLDDSTALDASAWSNISHTLNGVPVTVRRVSFTPWLAFVIVVAKEQKNAVEQNLLAAGALRGDAELLETLRLEAGWPRWGVDILDKCLPQELHRDAQAISFVKGCYIGQETVARIDALGHVNRYLVSVIIDSEAIPAPGTELTAEGQVVGQVTSAAYSPRHQATLALAYVRRGKHPSGTALVSPLGPARVL